ncbi:hypothetical protein ZOSMA_306G00140 [Zostera marina]|uniref:Uncharacterized protein n=1 Tax=Zostera marina TaxID=29655 RepID=A0A0K9PAA9_ZOSMR|nr:hypothetical protein ZOSMA_306G00140 [Zostera marina]
MGWLTRGFQTASTSIYLSNNQRESRKWRKHKSRPTMLTLITAAVTVPSSLFLPGFISLPPLNKQKLSRYRLRRSSSSSSSTGDILKILQAKVHRHVRCVKSVIEGRKHRIDDLPGVFLPCLVGIGLSSLSEAGAAEAAVEPAQLYEIGEAFELGIQLSYLLVLLGLLGAGTFFVIRQALVRRELDLSAKELQEQVRSGESPAIGYFELGAVMLRRKIYPAAIKYLQQAIEKWDGDDQDLAQVHNALGVSYVRENKSDKAILQFEKAVKLQPGYVTAWNNLGDAYDKKNDIRAALKAFEEVLLFDPNNEVARPRRDALRQRVEMYGGVSIKSAQKKDSQT